MGEMADMILDGTVCESCGDIFEDVLMEGKEAPGYPRKCAACERARQEGERDGR